MKRSWSPAAEQKLRELYGRAPLEQIAFLLKRTQKAVRSRAKVLGITTGKRKPWSAAERRLMRTRYPHEKTANIAAALGRPLHQVNGMAASLGLHKTAKYLASPDACRLRRGEGEAAVGFKYRFQKGLVPANKGLRRPGWHAGRMKETQFKKGQVSHNLKPLGTELYNSDNYLVRKVAQTGYGPNDWKPVHRLLWIEAHGPIPPGHIVAFKDGDKTHVKLENLELISMAENARRNVMWRKMPKELAGLVMLRAAVQRQINKRDPRAKEQTHERRKAARRALRHAVRIARQGKPDGHRAREGGRAGR